MPSVQWECVTRCMHSLLQLFAGVPLFNGEKNNDMLWLQQSLLGRLPNRMTRTHLRQCAALGIEAHFDSELRFLHSLRDPVTHAKVSYAMGRDVSVVEPMLV